MTLHSFTRALLRRKHLDVNELTETKLDRCLSTADLTALGIGSTLGLGIYVIAGQVASCKAGPAVTISFLVAAVSSVFAGLCYAEFGSRVPRAGSAYVYSYVTVGEFVAFIIGWNLILEYVIGTASVARGYSGYLDSLFNHTIKHHLTALLPMNLDGISPYPDFLALGITLFLTVMLVIGVKESSRFNNVFTCLNLLIVLYAVVCGMFKADIHNWNLPENEIPHGFGTGGFFPYGFSGMMAGAATCFYGFVGFDVVATTGEEVKNPQRAIPISIVLSLLCVFVAYFSVAAVETLMWPYWDQDQPAPLPYVFQMVGWPVARWIIAIGALAGLSTSLLGGMFPLPRVLYAMATDGVIFRCLANIHPRFKTPVLATALSGIFAGTMAMMFDVDELADMMSIGTLLAYTLVALSVLILRYKHEVELLPLASAAFASSSSPTSIDQVYKHEESEKGCDTPDSTMIKEPEKEYHSMSASTLLQSTHTYTPNEILRQCLNADRLEEATDLSSRISVALILSAGLLLVVFDVILITLESELSSGNGAAIAGAAIVTLWIVFVVYCLTIQPPNPRKVTFMVPLVPLVPLLSVWINFYLMLKLSYTTWIRFAVWMALGFMVYFFYGIRNSSEGLRPRERNINVVNCDEDELDCTEDARLIP